MIRSTFAVAAVAAGMLAFGTVATAEDKKEVKLTGPSDAIKRMFLITGFPASLHGY